MSALAVIVIPRPKFSVCRHVTAKVTHTAKPRSWPWWRWFRVSYVRPIVQVPNKNWRLWIYCRKRTWGLDLYLDRRQS